MTDLRRRPEPPVSSAAPSTEPLWWRDKEPVETLYHIASRLEMLIWGIDSDEAQEECEQAASVWMRDAREIVAEWRVK